MKWVTVTDENGITLHGQSDEVAVSGTGTEQRFNVWVFTDKASGFGDTVGQINLHQLKRLGDGSYGA